MNRSIFHRLLAVLLAAVLVLSAVPACFAAEDKDIITAYAIADSSNMLKYGHIDIAYSADDLLNIFALGDIVTVKVEGYGSFNVPVCASYDDVAAGEMLLRTVAGKDSVILAINYGQIALQTGLIEKAPEGADTAYVIKEGIEFPIPVTIAPKADKIETTVLENGSDMLKYGSINLDIAADDALTVFEYGETVIVALEGFGEFEVPVCAAYDDVAAGEQLLRVVSGKPAITLAINYGQLAVEIGLAEKAPEGSASTYVAKEGVQFPISAVISKKVVKIETTVLADGPDMLKYGSVNLDFVANDALDLFELGDIVTIELEGFGSFDVPVCAAYDDVAAGEKLLRVVAGKNYLTLAINYGQIAMEIGLIEVAPEGAASTYVVKEGIEFPINATVTLKQSAAGSENIVGSLIRTDERTDYPELTDAQFANFRVVTTTGIADGILYRSSNPINPDIKRDTYADAAAAEAGVKTFINLADTEAGALAYPGYADTYYAAQNHIFLGLPAAFTSDIFTEGLAEGFRFMLNHEGPYLVHCNEGKDRAGLTAAILECLTGATYAEVVDDYTETYRCYFTVEDGVQRALTEQEEEAVGEIIVNNLKLAYGVDITPETDLAAATEAYLAKIGLSTEEIASLKALLSK